MEWHTRCADIANRFTSHFGPIAQILTDASVMTSRQSKSIVDRRYCIRSGR
ncbi:MAG: hypothetical protein ACK52S_14840 [Pirellula sp.]